MVKITGFKECRKRLETIVTQHVTDILVNTCLDLINEAIEQKEYTGFTGNTQTSYTCGLYLNGKLCYTMSSGNKLPKPVHSKIKKGQFLHLTVPYEGDMRSIYGEVETNKLSGQKTAERFLKSYKVSPKKGFAIVMATGTEYSEFLEQKLDLNVLGSVYLRARDVLFRNIKKIK